MRFLGILLAILISTAALAVDPTQGFFFYPVEIKSVHDGDTVKVDIDLGMRLLIHDEPIRLIGIDAPELSGTTKVAGLASRDYLAGLLKDHRVILETVKDSEDKYGRLLGKLLVEGKGDWCPLSTWCDANAQMVTAGHAVYRTF